MTYSRAKGLFAGLDLTGEYLGEDHDETKAEYGPGAKVDSILGGQVPVPQNAQHFEHTVARYFIVSKTDH